MNAKSPGAAATFQLSSSAAKLADAAGGTYTSRTSGGMRRQRGRMTAGNISATSARVPGFRGLRLLHDRPAWRRERLRADSRERIRERCEHARRHVAHRSIRRTAHAPRRDFILARPGQKSVGDVVVLDRACGACRTEHAVVVRDDQPSAETNARAPPTLTIASIQADGIRIIKSVRRRGRCRIATVERGILERDASLRRLAGAARREG